MPYVDPPINAILVLVPIGLSLGFFPFLFFNVGKVATTISYVPWVHKYSHSPSHGLQWQVCPKFFPNNITVNFLQCTCNYIPFSWFSRKYRPSFCQDTSPLPLMYWLLWFESDKCLGIDLIPGFCSWGWSLKHTTWYALLGVPSPSSLLTICLYTRHSKPYWNNFMYIYLNGNANGYLIKGKLGEGLTKI